MISKKEIWLYFFNLLRKWKLTMKENIPNTNVFCTFTNASDVFWLKWQITQQDGGNLNDFLRTTTTIFDNPRKFCEKMFFAKPICMFLRIPICTLRNSKVIYHTSIYVICLYYRYICVKGQWRVTSLLRWVVKVILLLPFETKETTLLGPLQAT